MKYHAAAVHPLTIQRKTLTGILSGDINTLITPLTSNHQPIMEMLSGRPPLSLVGTPAKASHVAPAEVVQPQGAQRTQHTIEDRHSGADRVEVRRGSWRSRDQQDGRSRNDSCKRQQSRKDENGDASISHFGFCGCPTQLRK